MMAMKKILSFVLIFAMLALSLLSCTPDKPEAPIENPNGSESEADGGEIVGEPVYITLDVC